MKSFFNEFKAFAMRGNVVDMAIGIIIGAAFGKIISSFVNDILMPPIGLLLGGMDFKDLLIVIRQEPLVTIKYGILINTIIDFIIIAFVIFLIIKMMNNMKKKQEEAPPAPPAPSKEEILLTEIRDLLKK